MYKPETVQHFANITIANTIKQCIDEGLYKELDELSDPGSESSNNKIKKSHRGKKSK